MLGEHLKNKSINKSNNNIDKLEVITHSTKINNMKKIIFILLSVVILPLTSCDCNNDDDNIGRRGNQYKDLIIGKWEYTKTEVYGKPTGVWESNHEFFMGTHAS